MIILALWSSRGLQDIFEQNFEQPSSYSPYIFYAGALNMDVYCKYAKYSGKLLTGSSVLEVLVLVGKHTPATCWSMQKSDLKVSEIILATILGAASLF